VIRAKAKEGGTVSKAWITVIVIVIVAVGIMVVVGGDNAECGTPTTRQCGPGNLPPDPPPIPPGLR